MAYNCFYGMRANKNEVAKFKKFCKIKLDMPHQDVTREMMNALIDGRLTITRSDKQTEAIGALYNEH